MDFDGADGTTGSSYLRVTFSKLARDDPDDLPMLDEALAAANRLSGPAQVHVGWLPVLSIGLVARDGVVVGQLGRETRTFVFDAKHHRGTVERLKPLPKHVVDARQRRGSGPLPLPPSDELGNRPSVLGNLSYPLWVSDGRLLSISPREGESDRAHLLIPCSEVVRVTYAPHSDLARALLDDDWESSKGAVVDVGRTRSSGDCWHVATRGSLREEHVAVAGNLALNPVASRRASLIRSEIVSPEKSGPIHADLPFDWSILEIRVACVQLTRGSFRNRWLGYEITGIAWPDAPQGPPARIEWTAAGEPPPAPAQGDATKDAPTAPTTVPPDGKLIDATSDADPGPGRDTDVVRTGAGWLNRPVIVRLKAEPTGPLRQRYEPSGEEQADSLSAGAGSRRPTGSSRALPQATRPLVDLEPLPALFSQACALLDGLVETGALVSYEPVKPPQCCAAERGGLPAWTFPEVKALKAGGDDPNQNWFVRDFRSGRRRRVLRAALVLRVVHPDGIAILIETEPRLRLSQPKLTRSLAFVPADGPHLHAAVRMLLRVAAERSGVWPDEVVLTALQPDDGSGPAVASAATWRHVRRKDANGVVASQPTEMLAAITRVVAAAQAP